MRVARSWPKMLELCTICARMITESDLNRDTFDGFEGEQPMPLASFSSTMSTSILPSPSLLGTSCRPRPYPPFALFKPKHSIFLHNLSFVARRAKYEAFSEKARPFCSSFSQKLESVGNVSIWHIVVGIVHRQLRSSACVLFEYLRA